MHIDIVHELPGRLRFRLRLAADSIERIFDHLADACAETGDPFELSYDRRSRRFLLVGDRDAALRDTLSAAVASYSVSSAAGMQLPRQPAASAAVVLRRRYPDRSSLENHGSALSLILSRLGRFLLAGWLIPAPLQPAAALVRAWPFLRDGWRDLMGGRASVAVLDASAIAASMAMRDFSTASSIAFLLELGELLTEWTSERTRRSLSALFLGEEQPVWVLRDDREVRVGNDELSEGDQVVIRAGARLPVDGVVQAGEALVNQSSMTGEALAKRRAAGHSVYAGTVVEEGHLVVTAQRVGDGTRFAAIARLLENAQALQADVTSEAERLAQGAVPYTFALSALVLLATRSFVRAASVLVVDYSCARKLAAPLAIKAAMTEATAHGALIKGGRHLETLARANVFIFDKTGTLTLARPEVVNVYPYNGFSRDYVLRNAACLEEHFPHPIATAIVHQALQEGLRHDERHAQVEYVLAHGIASSLDGQRVLIGSRHFVADDEGIDVSGGDACAARCAARGESILYFVVGGQLAGLIAINDPIDSATPAVLRRLRQLGIARIVLLTGDSNAAAATVAGELAIDEVFAEVLPDDKTVIVQRLKEEGNVVAMVGDGMNDSAALAQADLGIALSHGADVAREACDVLLLDGQLASLLDGIEISRGTLARVGHSFRITLGANSALLALGLFGLAPAALLALLHNAATVGICAWIVRPLLAKSPSIR